MSYKTGGLKAKFIPPYYGYLEPEEYTIYAALESVSDVMSYRMFDKHGTECKNIILGAEDDSSYGQESLIDVLYHLKHDGPGTYQDGRPSDPPVVVEEMSREEMSKIFGY